MPLMMFGVFAMPVAMSAQGQTAEVLHEPNQATVEAMQELECGDGKEFAGLDELYTDLGI